MVSNKKDKNEVKDMKFNNLKKSETGWKVHEFSFGNESSSMYTINVHYSGSQNQGS